MQPEKNIQISNPEKKQNVFVGKISASTKRLRLRISRAKLINMVSNNKNGYILKVFLMDTHVEQQLRDIDTFALDETKRNNGTWFNNALANETIDEMFRPSLNIQNHVMTLLMSESREPNIFIDGKLADEPLELNDQSQLSIDIEASGLFFYPQKFGIRWIVNNVYKNTIESHEHDESNDWVDKKHVEQCWNDDIHAFNTSVDDDIASLHERIIALEGLKGSVAELMTKAKNKPEIDQDWHMYFASIKDITGKYYLR
jgi:hypothetical protein